MTRLSYEVSKRLKEFLGDAAVEPMEKKYYCKECGEIHHPYIACIYFYPKSYPAYQLHDLLSRPFCEAMAERVKSKAHKKHRHWIINATLSQAYYIGGLPAVEKALMEMMEDK